MPSRWRCDALLSSDETEKFVIRSFFSLSLVCFGCASAAVPLAGAACLGLPPSRPYVMPYVCDVGC